MLPSLICDLMVIKPSTWQRMDWELLGNSVNSVSLSLLSAGEEIMIEVINAICFIAILLNHSLTYFLAPRVGK